MQDHPSLSNSCFPVGQMESIQRSCQNKNQIISCPNSFDERILQSFGQCETTLQSAHDPPTSNQDWARLGLSQFCLTNSLLAAYNLTTRMPKSNTCDFANFIDMMEKRRTMKMLNLLENPTLE
jgi:hypothetical protein